MTLEQLAVAYGFRVKTCQPYLLVCLVIDDGSGKAEFFGAREQARRWLLAGCP